MPDYRQRLEQQKQASTLQLLFKASRLANERALAMVRQRAPDSPVRPAHTALFPHIDLEGTRQTVLASRLGISKQAVGQLVDDLVAMGMVERVPDPDDARARLVCFTATGRLALLDGLAVLMQLQAELGARAGPESIEELHRGLVALLAALEDAPTPG
jgi:DNA-binding MarR family transcriptional regulator